MLAVIPARGGSKGVPGKNVAPVRGVALVARAVQACRQASRVTAVAVSTDDEIIAASARAAGAIVVARPTELAGDRASSETAVLHAVETLFGGDLDDLEVVVLVQCTSPFLTSGEIDEVVSAVADHDADSAFTAAPFHGFLWRQADSAIGVNHDPSYRPRRQDRPEDLLETGAAYAMDAVGFRRHGSRFFGRTVAVRTDPARVLEIDEPADLERARALASLLDAPPETPTRADIDAVVLDFDGTQTDDRVWVSGTGRSGSPCTAATVWASPRCAGPVSRS